MSQERLFDVILAPHVTEKTSVTTGANNQYAFKIADFASKHDVKHAVEAVFGVQVESVRIVNIKGKSKRFGALSGKRSDIKKAYVSLKPGGEIDFTGGAE